MVESFPMGMNLSSYILTYIPHVKYKQMYVNIADLDPMGVYVPEISTSTPWKINMVHLQPSPI